MKKFASAFVSLSLSDSWRLQELEIVESCESEKFMFDTMKVDLLV